MRPLPPIRPTLRRERLIRQLAGRFERRLTIVRAGAGFGKTTLLGQAIDENNLDPRGRDVWVDVSTDMIKNGGLCPAIMGALTESDPPDVGTAESVADLVWQQAPDQIAIFLDNLHRGDEVAGLGDLLGALAEHLPRNGHLVLSTRTDVGFPHAKLLASGEAALITERDLAFDAADLESFAELRDVSVDDLGETGWPALLELRATVGSEGERDYVAEEVLTALGPERLLALQQVAALGWVDDEIVAEVTSYQGSASDLLHGVPLTSHDDNRIVLHDLWRSWLPALPRIDAQAAASRLAAVMESRAELPAAFSLYVEAHDFDEAAQVLRQVALDYGLGHSLAARRAMLASAPAELSASAAARLIEADVAFIAHPQSATPALEQARNAAQLAGDGELEAHVMLRQSENFLRSQNGTGLAEVLVDLEQLDSDDEVPIAAIRGLVEIWQAMLTNQMELAERTAREPRLMAYEPIAAHARFYSGLLASHTGYSERALDQLTTVLPQLRGRHATRAGGLFSMMQFYSGQMNDENRSSVLQLIERIEVAGHTHLYVEGAATVALYYVAAGDLAQASELLDKAEAAAGELPEGSWGRVMSVLARAAQSAVEGDEESASDLVEHVLPPGGPFDGLSRHLFNNVYALTYILSERSRSSFDADTIGPDFALARDIGRAVVALRSDGDREPCASLPWATELDRIRAWAFEPYLAELAVGALVEGVTEAERAIKELRLDPHGSLELVAQRHDGEVAQKARELLAEAPRLPTETVRVEVLGEMRVEVGGFVQNSSGMRRRVVELLQLLIDARAVRRDHAGELLWPGLDTRKARNNLRVTLTHLVALLEPHRDKASPPWHIRSDRDTISLVASEFLELDVDEFRQAIREASDHDRSGVPSLALASYLAACEIYKGQYLTETADLDVGYEDRVRLQLDFVHAATRGAELLTASDRASEAATLASRAVQAEPLDEAGYIAWLSALHAAGRTHEAESVTRRSRTLFADEGLVPSEALERLLNLD